MAASGGRGVLKAIGQINRTLLPQMQTIRDSRLGKPLYLIYVDYKSVFFEFCSFIYKKPFKAVRNFCITGAFLGVWLTNPAPDSYATQLMEDANTLLLLSNKVRNPHCNASIQKLVRLNSENRLLVHNFGFFSVVRQTEYNNSTCVYEANCYYLKPRWIYLYKDVVDIGFLGKWYLLEKAMVDYDVNNEELSWLPDDQ